MSTLPLSGLHINYCVIISVGFIKPWKHKCTLYILFHLFFVYLFYKPTIKYTNTAIVFFQVQGNNPTRYLVPSFSSFTRTTLEWNSVCLTLNGYVDIHMLMKLVCLHLFQHVDTWSFNVFALNESSGDHALKFVFYELLTRYDLINRFKVCPKITLQVIMCHHVCIFPLPNTNSNTYFI